MIVYDSKGKYFYSDTVPKSEYFSAFSTKDLGDGGDATVIQQFFNENNLQVKNIVVLNQIHSTDVKVVSEESSDKIQQFENYDGLITSLSDVCISVKTADCVPIQFVDQKNQRIGVSHQGWKGTLGKMAQVMVQKFVDLASDRDDIIAIIGPSIGSCCYNIEEDLARKFQDALGSIAEGSLQKRQGDWYLNLVKLNVAQLVLSGVKRENIDFFPFCTKCDEARFGSSRRSGGKNFSRQFNCIIKL
ncbi:MAG: peptidoglycan editing factor PgeF [Patescibacteria group bacterium]